MLFYCWGVSSTFRTMRHVGRHAFSATENRLNYSFYMHSPRMLWYTDLIRWLHDKYFTSWKHIYVDVILLNSNASRYTTVSTVTRLRAGCPGFDSLQGQGIFLLATASRLTMGPIQPPFQWVLEFFPHLVPRLSIREAIPPLTHMSSWHYT
jgi:hypothetical protein